MAPEGADGRKVGSRALAGLGGAMILALGAVAAQAQAQAPAPAATPTSAAAPTVAAAPGIAGTPAAVKATTVFVDAVGAMRKNGSAKRLNAMHAEMEAQGWRFSDLEPYTENGDLVGFFVTYVK